MALGALTIGAIGRGLGDQAHHAVASFFVCAIAAVAYLLMARGQGDILVTQTDVLLTPIGGIVKSTDKVVFVARYVDWVVTTPLLLIGLIGVAVKEGKGRGLVGTAIGADILMIVTGLFGALSIDETNKYTWFIVSCFFFLIVLAVVWGPVKAMAAAEGGAASALYNKLLGILTVLWFIYPVLWLLGSEGTGAISLNAEVGVFAVIDLLAKVGFGLVLVTGAKNLSSSSKQAVAS
jgi:bacteriorhodopsin